MDVTRLSLPAVCDLASTQSLTELLVALQSGNVELDGAQVERLSTPAAQALAAARCAYQAKGMSLAVMEPSEAMIQALSEVGLCAAVLEGSAP